MSWIHLAVPMMGAASLTLGMIFMLAWLQQRTEPARLMFALAAASVAVLAIMDLVLMQARTPTLYANVLRWAHVPTAVLMISLVGFVLLRFHAGRRWLALGMGVVLAGGLLANFAAGVNLDYQNITGLERIGIPGHGAIAIPIGDPNPWMLLANLSDLLMVLFLLDAIATVARRGDSRQLHQAMLVCGSMALVVLMASAWTASVILARVRGPLTVNVAYFAVILIMSLEMAGNLIRAERTRPRPDDVASRHRTRGPRLERRDATERFPLVIDGAPTAMLMIDGEGIITLANAQAGRVFGYRRAELLGRDIDTLVPDASREGHPHRRDGIDAHPPDCGKGAWREMSGRRKDGSEVRVEIGLTPMEVADELFVLASVTDTCERLRLEQETELQRDELAHLSRVTLLGEMSGSLAHELNQPLTAILSNAQAALRFLQHQQPDLGEVRDSLIHIVENDKRASEVIRRLRAMLRKEQADHQQLAINDVVRDVLGLINSHILNRHVTVTADLSPGLPPITGDRVQLQQVLLNLVINACDAMEHVGTGRCLTVTTREVSGPAVQVSISDTGRGIVGDELERIFTPFVTSKAEGIGLGLAICRTIVQAHRGALWASNNASRGATLHCRLPAGSRADDHASAAMDARRPSSREPRAKCTGRPAG